jgi:hypothetical protein
VPHHRLTVAETVREIEADLVRSKAQRHFLDFVVDGVPLYPDFRRRGFDCITPLWLGDATARPFAVNAARRLLGELEGDAPGERVTVYSCAECGDLGCGAVTVRITVENDTVAWRDWGWQTNYDEEVSSEDLADLGDMEFHRREYEAVLADALTRLAGA